MNIKLLRILFLSLFFFPAFSFCQVDDSLGVEGLLNLSLDELLQIKVNVSSTKANNIFSSPSSVSIITRETIQNFQFGSVAEAVAIVPGIDVLQTIIDRNVATSRGILQNFYANKILLLINNVPTWQPIYGDGHLERVSINSVERIEVLKGPASVLYGGNAYTAVINIITTNQLENSTRIMGSAGFPTFGSAGVIQKAVKGKFTNQLSIHASMENRKPYIFEAASGHTYNGDSLFVQREKYYNSSITNITNFKEHTLQLNYFQYNHTFLGEHPSYVGGAGNLVENQGILANYNYQKKFTKKFQAKTNLGYDFFQRDFPLSADRVQLIKIAGARYFGDLSFHAILNQLFEMEFGMLAENRVSYGHDTWNAQLDTLMRHNLTNDQSIQEASAFLQMQANFQKISLLMGGRYTLNSLFGDNFSFRSTLQYALNSKNSLKLIVGQSFRVPTMFELYFDHRTVQGNRDLMPETSNSYEIAYLTSFGDFFIQSLVYYAQYNDLIQRVSIPDEPSSYENASNFNGYGLETDIHYRTSTFGEAYLNYNYLNGDGDNEYPNFLFVPNHTLSFGLCKNLNNFFFSTDGRMISETQGSFEAIPMQFFLNIGFGYEHTLDGRIIRYNASVKNITKSRYKIPEYIRRTSNVNSIPTLAFGRRFIFSVSISL